MLELAVTMVFLAFTTFREYFFYVERQKLIDRIMSKDYAEFKSFEQSEKVETKQKSKDEGVQWL